MNRRILIVVAALAAATFVSTRGALSEAAQMTRKAINLPDRAVQAPFSDAILAGNTLYISGKIGLDAKTGKPPADIDEEIKLMLDGIKATVTQGGMTMDDVVYVTVYCSDLSLYDKFNAAYKTYFTKDMPA
ncbi:MAG TPA: RidA family protein, partial [Candidatus Acidoferrales bacterium]|nr:RidA family protein [Candidatus Acidoferrales bacterium]